MPGGGRYTMRSRRLWTLSSDRMGLSCDTGIVGIPVGLFFSATGILVLTLIPFGLFFSPSAMPVWKGLISLPLALLIGCGHLAGGGMLLWRQRTMLDRRRRTISTRGGWLGMVRKRCSFDDIASIRVSRVKCPHFYYSPLDMIYEVSIVAYSGQTMAVGYASAKPLAMDIENELRCFLSQ